MIEYMPWSKGVVADALETVRQGVFSALDIELSGKCPYSCVYCETPYRDRGSSINFTKIEQMLDSGHFKWVYICGIGEPTYDCNEEYLIRILEACKRNGARCSIFTNLSNLSEKLIEYILEDILYLIIKYDSLDAHKIQGIYYPDDVSTHLKNIELVYNLVKVTNNKTNIAASIVPTTYNSDDIVSLVASCLEKGIFPLLGQLENTGSAKGVYDSLSLNDFTLASIKSDVEKMIGKKYLIPFCPSVIAGIHVSNDNKITVDHRTGLSCHWFWLDDPDVDIVCDLNDITDPSEIASKLIRYRKERYQTFLDIKHSLVTDVFGGCGGNKKEIFSIYSDFMERGRWCDAD